MNVIHDHFHVDKDGIVVTATLKLFPDDFEVVEIPIVAKNDELSTTTTRDDDCSSQEVAICRYDADTSLDELILEEDMKILSKMNEWFVNLKPEGEQSMSTSSEASESCHNMKILNDDKARLRRLHDVIKLKFPFLRTETNREDHDSKEYIIRISPDRSFMPLLQHGVQLNFIEELYIFRSKGPQNHLDSISLGSVIEKSSRQEIHRLLKATSPHFDINTNSDDKSIYICWNKKSKRNHNRKDQAVERSREASQLSKTKANELYIGFNLHKYNVEHSEAMDQLCQQLECRLHDISYGGIKDRRAKTTQLCCWTVRLPEEANDVVNRTHISRALQRLHTLSQPHRRHPIKRVKLDESVDSFITVSSIQARSKPINKGDIWGNTFHILLRNLSTPVIDMDIHEIKRILLCRLDMLKVSGFPNYFGSQRMGWSPQRDDRSPGELPQGVLIGKLLVLERYNEAIDVILLGERKDAARKRIFASSPLATARQLYLKESSFQEVFDMFPVSAVRERSVLHSLVKLQKQISVSTPDFWRQVVDDLPYQWKSLWISSYQSWLWNDVASHRLATSGPDRMIGDLIVDDNGQVVISSSVLESPSSNIIMLPLFGSHVSLPDNDTGRLVFIQLIYPRVDSEVCRLKILY